VYTDWNAYTINTNKQKYPYIFMITGHHKLSKKLSLLCNV